MVLSFIVPLYKIEQWNPHKTIISLILSPFAIALTQEGMRSFYLSSPHFQSICRAHSCFLAHMLACHVPARLHCLLHSPASIALLH